MKAHMVGFVETRLSGPLSRYEIEGFDFACSESEQSAHGMAVYCRNPGCTIAFHTFGCVEVAITVLSGNIFIGFVYCPPKAASVAHFTTFLHSLSELIPENAKIVLLGDFNYDTKHSHSITKRFKVKMQLNQIMNSVTTDYGSYIDHIYKNFDNDELVAYGTLESYYSDHKPLYLFLKTDC